VGQRGHSKRRGLYIMSMKREQSSSIAKTIFVHHRILSAVESTVC
jgi:hypothetical protein